MFYLLHNGVEWALYAVNRTAGTVSRLGTNVRPHRHGRGGLASDEPSLILDTKNRKLYEVALPSGTATLLHNFDAEIPTGGYPSSRVQIPLGPQGPEEVDGAVEAVAEHPVSRARSGRAALARVISLAAASAVKCRATQRPPYHADQFDPCRGRLAHHKRTL